MDRKNITKLLSMIFKIILTGSIVVGVISAFAYVFGVHDLKKISTILTYVGGGFILWSITGLFGQSESYRNDIRITQFISGKKQNAGSEGSINSSGSLRIFMISVVIFVYSVLLWK